MDFRPRFSYQIAIALAVFLISTGSTPARAAGIGDYVAPFQSLATTIEAGFAQLIALVEPHHVVTVEISPATMAKWHASGTTDSAAVFNSTVATSPTAAASPTLVHVATTEASASPVNTVPIVTASGVSPAPVDNLAGYVTEQALSQQLSDLSTSMRQIIYNQNAQSTSSLYASLWGAIALSQRIDTLPSTVTVGGSTIVTQASLPALSGISGLLGISQGGTGITTVPTYGQILVGDGNGNYTLVATSSLGLAGGGSSPWALSGSNVSYSSGNVGIGTTSPSATFAVNGSGYFSGNLFAQIAALGTLSLSGPVVNASNFTASANLGPSGLNIEPYGSDAASNYMSVTGTATHSYIAVANGVFDNFPGSGIVGPADADVAEQVSAQKNNYLTSTIDGEIDSLEVMSRQGEKGDTGGIVIDAEKTKTGTAADSGGVLGYEIESDFLNASGTPTQDMHVLAGFGEGAGGISGSTGYGYYSEARLNNIYSAYHVDTLNQYGGARPRRRPGTRPKPRPSRTRLPRNSARRT